MSRIVDSLFMLMFVICLRNGCRYVKNVKWLVNMRIVVNILRLMVGWCSMLISVCSCVVLFGGIDGSVRSCDMNVRLLSMVVIRNMLC